MWEVMASGYWLLALCLHGRLACDESVRAIEERIVVELREVLEDHADEVVIDPLGRTQHA